MIRKQTNADDKRHRQQAVFEIAESLVLLGDDGAQVHDERQLGKFGRLDAERPDAEPAAGAVALLADERHERKQNHRRYEEQARNLS